MSYSIFPPESISTPAPTQQGVLEDNSGIVSAQGNELDTASDSLPGHGPETLALCASGVSKELSDVKVGDVLCGPDCRPRLVLKIARGPATMTCLNMKSAADRLLATENTMASCAVNNTTVAPVAQIYGRGSVAARASLERIVGGPLPDPLVLSDNDKRKQTVVHRLKGSFGASLRLEASCCLHLECTPKSRAVLMNALLDIAIQEDATSFIVRHQTKGALKLEVFSFKTTGLRATSTATHAFESRAEAFSAAKAFVTSKRTRTVDNLADRYEEMQVDYHQHSSLVVDDRIPGIYLNRNGRTAPFLAVVYQPASGPKRQQFFHFNGDIAVEKEGEGLDNEEDEEDEKDEEEEEGVDNNDATEAAAPSPKGATFEMSRLRDVLSLSAAGRKKRLLHRAVPVEFPSQPLPIDPTFLGAWLSDVGVGAKAHEESTVVDWLKKKAEYLDHSLVYRQATSTAVTTRPPHSTIRAARLEAGLFIHTSQDTYTWSEEAPSDNELDAGTAADDHDLDVMDDDDKNNDHDEDNVMDLDDPPPHNDGPEHQGGDGPDHDNDNDERPDADEATEESPGRNPAVSGDVQPMDFDGGGEEEEEQAEEIDPDYHSFFPLAVPKMPADLSSNGALKGKGAWYGQVTDEEAEFLASNLLLIAPDSSQDSPSASEQLWSALGVLGAAPTEARDDPASRRLPSVYMYNTFGARLDLLAGIVSARSNLKPGSRSICVQLPIKLTKLMDDSSSSPSLSVSDMLYGVAVVLTSTWVARALRTPVGLGFTSTASDCGEAVALSISGDGKFIREDGLVLCGQQDLSDDEFPGVRGLLVCLGSKKGEMASNEFRAAVVSVTPLL